MKLLKISGWFSKLKPSKLEQDTISPELFNQMLATCSTKAERKALYGQANSLPNDIVVLSVEKNTNKNFSDAGKYSTTKEFRNFLQDLLGTFVNYSNKNKPDVIKRVKISDEELIPPDKSTMKAISEKLSWM